MTGNLKNATLVALVSTLAFFGCGTEEPSSPDDTTSAPECTGDCDSPDTSGDQSAPTDDSADQGATGSTGSPDDVTPPDRQTPGDDTTPRDDANFVPPMDDPSNPCYGVREIDGEWYERLTEQLMTVTCVPLVAQHACEVSFAGEGAYYTDTFVISQDNAVVPLIIEIDPEIIRDETGQDGWWELTVSIEGGRLFQTLEYDDIGGQGTDRVEYLPPN